MAVKVAALPNQIAQVRTQKINTVLNEQVVEVTMELIKNFLVCHRLYADGLYDLRVNKFVTNSSYAAEMIKHEHPEYEICLASEKEWDLFIDKMQKIMIQSFHEKEELRANLNKDLNENYISKLKDYKVKKEDAMQIAHLVNQKLKTEKEKFKHVSKALSAIISINSSDFNGKDVYKSIIIGSWLRAIDKIS